MVGEEVKGPAERRDDVPTDAQQQGELVRPCRTAAAAGWDGKGLMAEATVAPTESASLERVVAQMHRLSAVVTLARHALAGMELAGLADEAAATVARTLRLERTAILEPLPNGHGMVLHAGAGWKPEDIGRLALPLGQDSLAGYVLEATAPVVVDDLSSDPRFGGEGLLRGCGVVSSVSVAIRDGHRAYGLIAGYATQGRAFESDEIGFMQSVADVLAAAIKRTWAEDALRESEERFFRLFQLNPVATIISRRDDELILDVNANFLNLIGYRREEVIGRKASDLSIWVGSGAEHLTSVVASEGGTPGHEVGLRTRAGEIRDLVATSQEIELQAEPCVLTSLQDVTDRKRAEEQLRHVALHDSLTGLANRSLFDDRLRQAVLAAQRDGGAFALLYIDLNRFKEVNDAFGHAGGDEFLRLIAQRLRGVLRASDTAARLGGDEFGVLLSGVGDQRTATMLAEKIAALFREPVEVGRQSLRVEASVGVALYPRDGADADLLMRHADAAMYAAKGAGTGYSFYVSEGGASAKDRLAAVAALREAIERDQLILEYQPIVRMRSRDVASLEALARWYLAGRGAVPPDEFIPLAEETGLIRPLGTWVLGEALRSVASWKAVGLPASVAVNLSLRQLQMADLPGLIAAALESNGLAADLLTIEITETAMMGDPGRTIEILRSLRTIGVRLAVDDYGTGYSSLAYLQRLPVQQLKIDRSFVIGMSANPASEAIVRSTIALAHDLGLEVVAEGVERQETWDLLASLGCDLAQGYLIGRPMTPQALRRWYRHGPRAGSPVLLSPRSLVSRLSRAHQQQPH